MKTTTLLPLPSHFDGSKVSEIYRVEYAELAPQAEQWAKQHGIKPAATDKTKVCLMIIDAQNTFCHPDFELFVAGRSGRGAIEDNERLCNFIYGNLDKITQISPTMDTHTSMQIFHPIFWVDGNGKHPVGNQTIITLDDVKSGKWRVNPAVSASLGASYVDLERHALHYVTKLTEDGKYPLMIWTYHAMLGGIGHALVPAIEEAAFFHCHARASQTNYEIKGGNPLSENYSVLRPEVTEGFDGHPIGQKNTRFIKRLLEFDVIAIAGQAKSHCVAWTIDDLLTDIKAQDPALAKKVYLLEDCTSPVVVRDGSGNIIPGLDFTDMANDAFQRFTDAGMNVVSTNQPMEEWPNLSF